MSGDWYLVKGVSYIAGGGAVVVMEVLDWHTSAFMVALNLAVVLLGVLNIARWLKTPAAKPEDHPHGW